MGVTMCIQKEDKKDREVRGGLALSRRTCTQEKRFSFPRNGTYAINT